MRSKDKLLNQVHWPWPSCWPQRKSFDPGSSSLPSPQVWYIYVGQNYWQMEWPLSYALVYNWSWFPSGSGSPIGYLHIIHWTRRPQTDRFWWPPCLVFTSHKLAIFDKGHLHGAHLNENQASENDLPGVMVEACLSLQTDSLRLARLSQQEFILGKFEETLLAWSQQMRFLHDGGGNGLPHVLQLQDLSSCLVWYCIFFLLSAP